MSDVPDPLRRAVVTRAEYRCEYCGLSQAGQEATFHIDHILPVSAGGATTSDNLALACVSCSLRKSARSSARDPVTQDEVQLFHPRKDVWDQHFGWDGLYLNGKTPSGRATVSALDMNRPMIIASRGEEALLARHPPPKRPR